MNDNNQGSNDNGGLLKVLTALSKKFDGKSEEELITAIEEEADRRKKAGTLTDESIERFCNSISPFLSAEKREKLKKVCNRIKSK